MCSWISWPISSVIVRPENCSVRLAQRVSLENERTERMNELVLNWIVLRKATAIKEPQDKSVRRLRQFQLRTLV